MIHLSDLTLTYCIVHFLTINYWLPRIGYFWPHPNFPLQLVTILNFELLQQILIFYWCLIYWIQLVTDRQVQIVELPYKVLLWMVCMENGAVLSCLSPYYQPWWDSKFLPKLIRCNVIIAIMIPTQLHTDPSHTWKLTFTHILYKNVWKYKINNIALFAHEFKRLNLSLHVVNIPSFLTGTSHT